MAIIATEAQEMALANPSKRVRDDFNGKVMNEKLCNPASPSWTESQQDLVIPRANYPTTVASIAALSKINLSHGGIHTHPKESVRAFTFFSQRWRFGISSMKHFQKLC